jgi:hypothetical protein
MKHDVAGGKSLAVNSPCSWISFRSVLVNKTSTCLLDRCFQTSLLEAKNFEISISTVVALPDCDA